MTMQNITPLGSVCKSTGRWGRRGQERTAGQRALREARRAIQRAALWLDRAAGQVESAVDLAEETAAGEADRLRPLVARLVDLSKSAEEILLTLRCGPRGEECRRAGRLP